MTLNPRAPMTAAQMTTGQLDTAVPAVILKLDRNVMHHGGLGAIRSLGRLGVPVYGVHEDRLAPAARSRYLHDRVIWRAPADDAHRVRAELVMLAERIGRPAVLIPTDDAGAIFLAEHGADLRQWFLFPDPPIDLPRRLAGKYTLYQLCLELGVPCVAATLPGSLAEAREFADRVGFPLVAKLATPWRSSSAQGLRSTSVVRSCEGLARSWRRCAEHDGATLMLQEYIPQGQGPGQKAQDYFFHGYCDAQSRCRPAFIGIKERSYPAHAGLTSLGRWVDNPQLRHQATELLTQVGFRGIVDLDYRFDPRDGQYKLLDFNPRLGAQFRLFQDTAGVDVVAAAHLDLTGRGIPHGSPHLGRTFLVENYDPIAALAYRRCGLDFRSWLTSLRETDEFAWFAQDDLAPFGLMCLRMGWRAMTRPLRSAPRPHHHAASRTEALHMSTETNSNTNGDIKGIDDPVDVAIVGAGPYGLSLGAHLRAAGISFRQFGLPMQLWRDAMPAGMFLKSQGFASNLSDPAGKHTLRAFCQETDRDYADYGLPVPLETFVAYGNWFQRAQVPHLEELMVTGVTRVDGQYRISLADGRTALARKVVVATGVQHFSHLPSAFAALPAQVCTHTSAHRDLALFAGREVAVVGAGQSALESAALLQEAGAKVTILARALQLAWNGDPLADQRSIRRRLREPEAPLGSGWSTWFYSNQPHLFRRLPPARRVRTARTALGPAGAHWLRPRVEGKVRTLVGHSVRWAEPEAGGVQLGLGVNGGVNGGATKDVTVEHVLAATGYRTDLDRLTFLDPALRSMVRTLASSPNVGADFQSSAAGLYFIGPAVAPTFGPVMRFVYGSDYAARTVTRALTALPQPRAAVGARR